jgi:hypothetical protein
VRSHGGGFGRTSQLPTSFWTFTRFGRKVAGNCSTGLSPELTLEELASIPALQIILFLSAATGS